MVKQTDCVKVEEEKDAVEEEKKELEEEKEAVDPEDEPEEEIEGTSEMDI